MRRGSLDALERQGNASTAFGPPLLGHNDPDVDAAVAAVGRSVDLMGVGVTQVEVELAERLVANVSDGGQDCRRHNNNNRLDTRAIQTWIDDTVKANREK